MSRGYFLISTFYSVTRTKPNVPIQEMMPLHESVRSFQVPFHLTSHHDLGPTIYCHAQKPCSGSSSTEIQPWDAVLQCFYLANQHVDYDTNAAQFSVCWAEKYDQYRDSPIQWHQKNLFFTHQGITLGRKEWRRQDLIALLRGCMSSKWLTPWEWEQIPLLNWHSS